jgi:hypothetical protein
MHMDFVLSPDLGQSELCWNWMIENCAARGYQGQVRIINASHFV